MKYIIYLLLLLPLPATASPLIADLSIYTIDIDASFSGTKLYIFGARGGSGDIVAVLRGENRDFVVRKKEKIAGFWVNNGRWRINRQPEFYALASSIKLNDPENQVIFSTLGIGLSQLLPVSNPQPTGYGEYTDAYLRNQQHAGLYLQQENSVRFMGETLFKAAIDLPDNVPPGNYTAEVYLISDGEVVGMQSTPVLIRKAGLDAALADVAHHSPILYGIFAVSLAIFAGWLAGRVFEKI